MLEVIEKTSVDILMEELGFSQEIEEMKELILSILKPDKDTVNLLIRNNLTYYFVKAKNIIRFSELKMFKLDTNGAHMQRVSELVALGEVILKSCFSNFDGNYSKKLAYMHDYQEGLSPFGDIAAPKKMGLSKKSKELLTQIEINIAIIIGDNCWNSLYCKCFISFDYLETKKLFLDAVVKKSLEASIVSYFDKVDAFMISIQEVLLGNFAFIEPIINYIKVFKLIKDGKELNSLQVLFQKDIKELKKYLEINNNGFSDEDYKYFEGSHELFNIDSFIGLDIEKIKSTGEKKVKELLPAYGVWKKANLLSKS